jgi:Transglycosylase SLT domain
MKTELLSADYLWWVLSSMRVFGVNSPHKYIRLFAWSVALGCMGCVSDAIAAMPSAPFTTEQERCIVPAGKFHEVNPHILRAILRVESSLRPNTVTRNANGTLDVGMGGMNSSHFRELSKFGIAPEHLLDACVATYVAAWHLKKNVNKFGNTWFGVAAYHSVTPYFNQRYQVMLYNELVESGTVQGSMLRVPPLNK